MDKAKKLAAAGSRGHKGEETPQVGCRRKIPGHTTHMTQVLGKFKSLHEKNNFREDRDYITNFSAYHISFSICSRSIELRPGVRARSVRPQVDEATVEEPGYGPGREH